jgi:CYTH domain-containing protein
MLDTFEFERRFFCDALPEEMDDGYPPQLIIQNYYLAEDGYAIRIRLQASNLRIKMSEKTDFAEIIENYLEKFELAFITIKGPSIGGTRYEHEHSLDVSVAAELIKRGGKTIVKNRYWGWIGADGWVTDVFGAENHGLVIAEIERNEPVTNLVIPPWCLKEVTDDRRFSNDSLVNIPYSEFATEFAKELDAFKPDELFSTQFGPNTVVA